MPENQVPKPTPTTKPVPEKAPTEETGNPTPSEKVAPPPKPPKKKKMIGWPFWAFLALAVFKDLIDMLADLTVVLSVVSFVLTPIIFGAIYLYLRVERVDLTARKLTTMVIAFVIGFIPFVNLLPETTINLILIRLFENSATLRRLGGLAAGKVKS